MTAIERAVSILRAGGLVAFPTETVYGLGADATNSAAVEKIFLAKGRPPTNPLIVHVGSAETAKRFASQWPTAAEALAARFWPGPLTLVLPKSPQIPAVVTAGKESVGLRVPAHPLALDLLRRFGGPLAAPSANRSNHLSPTTAAHVRDDLGDSVDLVLDGGPCTVGIESTVLDLSVEPPRLLRPGGITREQIEGVIGPVTYFEGAVDPSTSASSPGLHLRHYAPRTPAFRFERDQWPEVAEILKRHDPRSIRLLRIGQSPVQGPAPFFTELLLDVPLPNDPEQAGRVLYGTLREIDCSGAKMILVEMPPAAPAWAAIRDRLTRASRPIAELRG